MKVPNHPQYSRGIPRAANRDYLGKGGGNGADLGASRRAHTGWLGDFGPVHTHTVREAPSDEGGEEMEEGGDVRGETHGRVWRAVGDSGEGGGRALGGDGGRDDSSLLPNETETSGGGRRSLAGSSEGYEGENSIGRDGMTGSRHGTRDDESSLGVSDGSDGGVGGRRHVAAGVNESTRGVASSAIAAAAAAVYRDDTAGSTDSSRGRSTDVVSPRAPAHPPAAAIRRHRNAGVGTPGGVIGGRVSSAVDDNKNISTTATISENVRGPIDKGLDAYLQLAASDNAALLAEVGGGVNTGGDAGGASGHGERGSGAGSEEGSAGSVGGYTGATTGSWWEEDRSALEVGDAAMGFGESGVDS